MGAGTGSVAPASWMTRTAGTAGLQTGIANPRLALACVLPLWVVADLQGVQSGASLKTAPTGIAPIRGAARVLSVSRCAPRLSSARTRLSGEQLCVLPRPRFPLFIAFRGARKINVSMERVVRPRGGPHRAAVQSRRRDHDRKPAIERSRALPALRRACPKLHQSGERGAVKTVNGERTGLPVVKGPPAKPPVPLLAPGEYASSETLVVAKVSRGLRVRHGPEPPLAGKQDGRTLQEAGARSRISP